MFNVRDDVRLAGRLNLEALSETLLPSSALSLVAASRTRLELSVRAATVASPTCVRITVAASLDGMLFGSRVIALWLHSAAATSEPPASCAGDGDGYVPAVWESSAPMMRQEGPAPAVVAGFSTFAFVLAAAAAASVWLLVKVNAARKGTETERTTLTKDSTSSSDYPEPTDSPGSQQGCFPVAAQTEVELRELAASVDEDHDVDNDVSKEDRRRG